MDFEEWWQEYLKDKQESVIKIKEAQDFHYPKGYAWKNIENMAKVGWLASLEACIKELEDIKEVKETKGRSGYDIASENYYRDRYIGMAIAKLKEAQA